MITLRRELALALLKDKPPQTTHELWMRAFQSTEIEHKVAPGDFYPTLMTLHKEGLVERVGKRQWKLPS